MSRLGDIVYESGDYYAVLSGKYYIIYKQGITSSTKVATIGINYGIERVRQEIERRQKLKNGLLDWFSTSTTRSVKKPLATKSSTGGMIFKGHKIWKTADGEFEVPSIEKGTLFDSMKDAKKFIGYWSKQQSNPSKSVSAKKWLKCKAVRQLPNGAIQILR